MLIECNFHEYTLSAMSDKSAWSIVYGTPSMPYGRFTNIIDGLENTSGWYSHICEGWSGYQDFGNPYVVIDLGSRVMIGQCGVQLAWSDGWYDTNPMAVEFYTTEQDYLDSGLTSAETGQLLSPDADRNYSDEFMSLVERAGNLRQHRQLDSPRYPYGAVADSGMQWRDECLRSRECAVSSVSRTIYQDCNNPIPCRTVFGRPR